jgi:hypothetical protein
VADRACDVGLSLFAARDVEDFFFFEFGTAA